MNKNLLKTQIKIYGIYQQLQQKIKNLTIKVLLY